MIKLRHFVMNLKCHYFDTFRHTLQYVKASFHKDAGLESSFNLPQFIKQCI